MLNLTTIKHLKIMKKIYLLFALFIALFISCDTEDDTVQEEEIEVNMSSIIPSSTAGRFNNILGCVEISSRITTIEVWDHGQIDGDIVSIIANGNTIINERTLDGPDNPISVDYNFGFNGFNYITLFAHNLGDIPPNTCTISINGVEFILEANLEANGSVNIVVEGFGVDCSDADSSGNGNNDDDDDDDSTGDIAFWINADYNCGPVTVNLSGEGSQNITSFFSSAPDCGTNGAANFLNLDPGNYSYTASCSGISWSGSVNVTANTCSRELLLPDDTGGGNDTGDVKFWIASDLGCGAISVSVTSVGSATINGFFENGAPDCSNTGGGGNFNNLAPGTYNFNASCTNRTWSDSFTVQENNCTTIQLN